MAKIVIIVTVVCVGVSMFVGATLAQNNALPGREGWTQEWNAAWLDLPSPMYFKVGDVIEFQFIGSGPTEVVVRFVPQSCGIAEPCEIDCQPVQVINGKASYTVAQTHATIKQISVHSGVSGLAWGCKVNGGPIAELQHVLHH